MIFPPQQVMRSGAYGMFVTENLLALQQCTEPDQCASVLFNLGFVYAYPHSPYYDASKALPYFDDLQARYPETAWAFVSQAWTALLKEKLGLEYRYRILEQENLSLQQENSTLEQTKYALEETQRRLQADLRARGTLIRNLQERQETIIRNRQERQETLIRDLQDRLNRSREIDLEHEKKARELLR
jgi:hypothetical protein